MGPMQGDVYARFVLDLPAGCEHPLHAGDEKEQDLLLGMQTAFELASGLSTGPRVAGVGCRAATIRPGSSSDIFMSVCYSSGSG